MTKPYEEKLTVPHAGPVCSEAVAGYQQETIKAIMAKQGLDFGPACDVYIRGHHASSK